MERVKQGFRSISKELEPLGSSSLSERTSFNGSATSSDQSRILVPRVPRQMVSLWTCTKLCAVGFAVGVVVGFTLKRRLRRWANKLLKQLKDD